MRFKDIFIEFFPIRFFRSWFLTLFRDDEVVSYLMSEDYSKIISPISFLATSLSVWALVAFSLPNYLPNTLLTGSQITEFIVIIIIAFQFVCAGNVAWSVLKFLTATPLNITKSQFMSVWLYCMGFVSAIPLKPIGEYLLPGSRRYVSLLMLLLFYWKFRRMYKAALRADSLFEVTAGCLVGILVMSFILIGLISFLIRHGILDLS